MFIFSFVGFQTALDNFGETAAPKLSEALILLWLL